MNKWFFFLGGVLTGLVLTILVMRCTKHDDDITLFDEPSAEVIEAKEFNVLQAIGKGAALATTKSSEDLLDALFGDIYLLCNDEDKYYYDFEKVIVPEDKVVRQIGIYRYHNKQKDVKTVPVVMIMNK